MVRNILIIFFEIMYNKLENMIFFFQEQYQINFAQKDLLDNK